MGVAVKINALYTIRRQQTWYFTSQFQDPFTNSSTFLFLFYLYNNSDVIFVHFIDEVPDRQMSLTTQQAQNTEQGNLKFELVIINVGAFLLILVGSHIVQAGLPPAMQPRRAFISPSSVFYVCNSGVYALATTCDSYSSGDLVLILTHVRQALYRPCHKLIVLLLCFLNNVIFNFNAEFK